MVRADKQGQPCLSVFQCRDRYDVYAVRPPVGSVGHAADYTESLRFFCFGICVELLTDFQQIFCTCVNLACAEFDFKAAPVPIRQFDDRINFTSLIILIVIQTGAKGVSVNAEIPFYEPLKKKSWRI